MPSMMLRGKHDLPDLFYGVESVTEECQSASVSGTLRPRLTLAGESRKPKTGYHNTDATHGSALRRAVSLSLLHFFFVSGTCLLVLVVCVSIQHRLDPTYPTVHPRLQLFRVENGFMLEDCRASSYATLSSVAVTGARLARRAEWAAAITGAEICSSGSNPVCS